MKGLTFRLNVYVCKPYNADFDGDEMNMHLPQKQSTKYELQKLTMVPTQIIDPSTNVATIVPEQDSLTGIYLFTQPDVNITKEQYFNLMMTNRNFNGHLPKPEKGEYWSSKQLYSEIIPDISVEGNNNSYDIIPDNKNHVIVKNGVLEQGVLDSKFMKGSGLSLTTNIYHTYGGDVTKDFLDNNQRILMRWLIHNGFTIHVGDCMTKPDVLSQIQEIMRETVKKTNTVIKQAHHGTYQPNLSDEFIRKSLDVEIQKIMMNDGYKKCMEINKKSLDEKNNFSISINSGAKGKANNITAIMVMLGQQDIYGERIPYGFDKRTLPIFPKDDFGVETRGFILSSFISGSKPHEFFFHQMNGRTGRIDTSIKTAESGYLQRRLIKAMEDVQVTYDGTVRNAANKIIQFNYGDDGIDPMRLETQKLVIMEMDNSQMRKKFLITDDDKKVLKKLMTKTAYTDLEKFNSEEELNKMNNYRNQLRNKYFKNLIVMTSNVQCPINFYRIISMAKTKFSVTASRKINLEPSYIINELNIMLNNFKKITFEYSLNIIEILVYSFLSPKVSIMENHMTKEAFKYTLDSITAKYFSCFIEPGEMIGTVTAQSIGEPSTQLTLNSFHSAGTGANSVITTAGVPRLKEIINLSKTIKVPIMNIYLKYEYSKDLDTAQFVKSYIEYTKMEDIVKETQIIYENKLGSFNNNEDIEFIKIYSEFSEIIGIETCTQDELSSWGLRIEFDKEEMMNKNIMLQDIQDVLNRMTDFDFQCIFSDDNASNVILRISIREDKTDDDYLQFLQQLEKEIMNIPIRGLKDINKVEVSLQKKVEYLPDGSYHQVEERYLITEGVNYLEALTNPYIDPNRISTNDIHIFYELYGIEATRNLLMKEIDSVFSNNGINVSPRHIALLVDIMTYKGILMSMERHGINSSADVGPLSKATFEESTNVMFKASQFGELDRMNGVSGNIMMGQYPHAGTNSFKVIFDEKLFIEKYKKIYGVSKKEEIKPYTEIISEVENKIIENSKKGKKVSEESFDFSVDITQSLTSKETIAPKMKSNKKMKVKEV